jgi:exopolysaccharide biosynthesis polyprenyl glycosylphosphotransferase
MNGLTERPTIEPRWLMPVVDGVLVLVSFAIGFLFRYELQIFRPVFDPSQREFLPYVPYALFYAVILYFTYQSSGLYRNLPGRTWTEELTLIAGGVANGTVILLALYFSLQPAVTSRLMLIYVAGLTIVMLGSARAVRHLVIAYLRTRGIGVQRVVIIGMDDVGKAVLRTMIARRDLGYKVVGFLDDHPERGATDLGRVVGLGNLQKLPTVIREHDIDLVVITLRWKHYDQIIEAVRAARDARIDVRVVPDIFQLNMRQVQVENLDGIPLLGMGGMPELKGTSRILKRVLDLGIMLLLAPFWLPVYGLVALAIKLDDGGKVHYTTQRIGENGRPFMMYKFRSMIPDADKYRKELFEQAGEDPLRPKLENDPRRTRVGKFIRRVSLDELPNLINVLRGEMSLVGPRPPLPDEVELYEGWHLQRLRTIPGLTGLWQVSGRSEIPFDEMCLMDIYYIENWSIKFDLQILLMTIPRVLLRSGAY